MKNLNLQEQFSRAKFWKQMFEYLERVLRKQPNLKY